MGETVMQGCNRASPTGETIMQGCSKVSPTGESMMQGYGKVSPVGEAIQHRCAGIYGRYNGNVQTCE